MPFTWIQVQVEPLLADPLWGKHQQLWLGFSSERGSRVCATRLPISSHRITLALGVLLGSKFIQELGSSQKLGHRMTPSNPPKRLRRKASIFMIFQWWFCFRPKILLSTFTILHLFCFKRAHANRQFQWAGAFVVKQHWIHSVAFTLAGKTVKCLPCFGDTICPSARHGRHFLQGETQQQNRRYDWIHRCPLKQVKQVLSSLCWWFQPQNK